MSGTIITPVTFSFGWVAYAFNFMFVLGDKKLMPDSDCPSIVINAKNGYVRTNRSWILGRILRDFDYWRPKEVKDELERLLDAAQQADWEREKSKANDPLGPVPIPPRRKRAGLCVSIFFATSTPLAGTPTNDLLHYSGIVTAIVQLGIAAIPCGLYSDWSVLMATAAGTMLAFASGALPQWKREKWQCRKGANSAAKTVILTRGNGAQHAIVIMGEDGNLNLEDLADSDGMRSTISQRVFSSSLAILWLALLVSVAGLKQNTWFLVAVGGLGMVQNVVVAGAPRRPEAYGVHIKLLEVIGRRKVMETLMAVEIKHPRMGASLLRTFCPGDLRPEEEAFWAMKSAESKDHHRHHHHHHAVQKADERDMKTPTPSASQPANQVTTTR